MPTDRKAQDVNSLMEAMKGCTIAISTDYSGLNVSEMSEFRTTLRENGIKYKVVKNTLFKIAADQAEMPAIKDLIDGILHINLKQCNNIQLKLAIVQPKLDIKKQKKTPN